MLSKLPALRRSGQHRKAWCGAAVACVAVSIVGASGFLSLLISARNGRYWTGVHQGSVFFAWVDRRHNSDICLRYVEHELHPKDLLAFYWHRWNLE